MLRPLGGPGDEVRCRLETNRDLHDATVHAGRHREAAIGEHVQHPPVVREHRRLEAADAPTAGDLRQLLEHARADAPPLQGIGDRKGHFGTVGPHVGPVEPGKRHHARRYLPDEGHGFQCLCRQQPAGALRVE